MRIGIRIAVDVVDVVVGGGDDVIGSCGSRGRASRTTRRQSKFLQCIIR